MAADAPTADSEGTGAGELAREVSAAQAALLGRLHEQLAGAEGDLFAATAQRLAEEFGAVTATAVGALWEGAAPATTPAPGPRGSSPPESRRSSFVGVSQTKDERDGGSAAEANAATDAATDAETTGAPERPGHPSLYRPGQFRRRLEQLLECQRRYEHAFALVVFDVEGPGARDGGEGEARETALAVTGAALGESVRLVDETFRLEEDALCVLAPGQTTVGGVQMAERLLGRLEDLEAAGGLRIGVSAGVVACPDHGAEVEKLLRGADEAMWRARAVGQPVGVGAMQDR